MRLPKHVAHVDNETEFDHGFIVTLANGYTFVDEPDCGVRAFDTMREVREAIKRENVIFAAPNAGAAVK